MNYQTKHNCLRTYIVLYILLFVFTLPTFAAQTTNTMDTIVGDYSGSLMTGEKGTQIHLNIQKISSSTGLVTLEGIEGQTSPIKYYMTYNSDTEMARFYPKEVASTNDLNTPYIFEGYCGKGMIAGLHDFYDFNQSTHILEDNFIFFKNQPATIHLNKGILNSNIDLPDQLIQSAVNGSTLENTTIDFYEYNQQFFSMHISFTAKSPQANYYYMLSLPEAVNTISVAKSPVSINASTYNNDFGRFIASKLPGDFYGPLSYTDINTQTKLNETYKDTLINQLNEDSVLGRTYHHYDTYDGVLSGQTRYELEFLFTGTLASFLETLETSPASLYIGGKEGEILLDNFAPVKYDWRDLLSEVSTIETQTLNTEGDYIRNVTISASELMTLLTDTLDKIDTTPENEIVDEAEMTIKGMTRVISIASNNDYYMVTLQNPEDRDDESFAIFDRKYNTRMLATNQNDVMTMELYSHDKVVVCESVDNGDNYTYNEYALLNYASSDKINTLKAFSLSAFDDYIK